MIKKEDIEKEITNVATYITETYFDKMSMESVAMLNLAIMLIREKIEELDDVAQKECSDEVQKILDKYEIESLEKLDLVLMEQRVW